MHIPLSKTKMIKTVYYKDKAFLGGHEIHCNPQ